VPDGFLSKPERQSIEKLLNSMMPGRKVLSSTEFKEWAMKNVNFSALKKHFNL